MTDDHSERLCPRKSYIEPIPAEEEFYLSWRRVAAASAHRKDHDGSLLPLELVHGPDAQRSKSSGQSPHQCTIRDDFGIFLPRTWRLHPDICRFISGAVYDDRLTCEPHTAQRVLVSGESRPQWLPRNAGLVYVPVEHEGNICESAEEEDRIQELVSDLLKLSVRQDDGKVRSITTNDILVVAPYNLQVILKEIFQSGQAAFTWVRTLDGLAELHLIANQNQISSGRSKCDQVSDRDLASLFDEQVIELSLSFLAA